MFFSLNLRTLRELSLGFGTIKASSWRCSGLRPGVSPVFDRTETILGEIFSPLARLPKLSLRALPPRELALGFGTIKASSWRCSGLIPGVSPVFDRTKNYSGGNLFPTRQAPRAVSGSASPPRARSRVRYHQGIFLALQRSTTGGLPGVRSYRKLFWGKSFPHSPGSQSCL